MDHSEFESRAVSTFHSLKYSFNKDFEQGQAVERLSSGHKALTKGVVFACAGIFAALGTHTPEFTDAEVKSAVDVLARLGDLVGLRLDTGGALLVLFIYADCLSEEAVVGKSALIRDELKAFKQFVMKMAWVKRGVIVDLFFVFNDSSKAFHFRQTVQAHCKHGEIFGKTYILPWGIDISAKSVWGYAGWPPPGYMSGLKRDEIEARLFSPMRTGT